MEKEIAVQKLISENIRLRNDVVKIVNNNAVKSDQAYVIANKLKKVVKAYIDYLEIFYGKGCEVTVTYTTKSISKKNINTEKMEPLVLVEVISKNDNYCVDCIVYDLYIGINVIEHKSYINNSQETRRDFRNIDEFNYIAI